MKPEIWLRHVLILPLRGYKLVVSPLLGFHCRYLPTCSDYAAEAIRTHGVFKGGVLSAKRVLRCHPWGGSGYDPVPEAACARHGKQSCCDE